MLLDRIFGGRRRAQPARATASPPRTPAPRQTAGSKSTGNSGLSLAEEPVRRPGLVDTEAGFDPYNSGAFVKKDGAWERVNRR
jgi:hypothetical protein